MSKANLERGKAAEKRLVKTLEKMGLKAHRILRGADWSQSLPDVVIEGWEDLKIDCKHYAKHRTHSLFREIQEKYCRPGSMQKAVLITSEKGKSGQLATIDVEFLVLLLKAADLVYEACEDDDEG